MSDHDLSNHRSVDEDPFAATRELQLQAGRGRPHAEADPLCSCGGTGIDLKSFDTTARYCNCRYPIDLISAWELAMDTMNTNPIDNPRTWPRHTFVCGISTQYCRRSHGFLMGFNAYDGENPGVLALARIVDISEQELDITIVSMFQASEEAFIDGSADPPATRQRMEAVKANLKQ